VLVVFFLQVHEVSITLINTAHLNNMYYCKNNIIVYIIIYL